MQKEFMDFSNQIILFEKNLQVGSHSDAGSETVVGFDGDSRKLVEQLMGEKKQLQIVSIVGMPGLGKTTLARKVYNDHSIVYHFYVRAWTYVAQVPRKRDLLLGLLRSGFDYRDEGSSDEKLSEMLKRRLSCQRYLIVLDDIWDIRVWNEMRLCFPDNKNGSRIILTSRLAEVPQQVQTKSYQHHLPLLTDAESWDLLQTKVFQKEKCPPWLVEIGRHITKKCHGLPLAIVVISGLLAKDMSPNWWSKVAKDMSSYADGDSKQYMDTLALSYNHLSPHLQPCFLYFGVFPEDYEIPVWKLILLWVAEGFIHKTGENKLEDIAAGFLKDLIHRSLVIVAKRGFDGEIKTCIVHDLLRDLCLTKAREENFLQQLERYESYIPMYPSRLCIHSPVSLKTISTRCAQNVQSILCCAREIYYHPDELENYLLREIIPFRVLRVLDLSSMKLSACPLEIGELVNLRYIAIRAKRGSIPASISNLQYLETLIASIDYERCHVINIWKMVNLRHIYINGNLKTCIDGHMYVLENLQSIKSLDPFSESSEEVLKRTPKLRKLRFFNKVKYPSSAFSLVIPSLDKLESLEKLTYLSSYRNGGKPLSLPSPFIFPVTLKKLSLYGTGLGWSEMEKIGMLPNLEVLKLQSGACLGERWETSDGGFHRLKYLQLKDLVDIVEWNASGDHFPILQHLKLEDCWELEGIPLGLGDIYTLELIEVLYCAAAEQSARKIKEDQESKGNYSLKISVRSMGAK